MSFNLITEPKLKTKPEQLFFMLLKISHDDGTLTEEILKDPVLYEKYKLQLYLQFSRVGEVRTRDAMEVHWADNKSLSALSDHLNQQDKHAISECLCSQQGLFWHCLIQNEITKKKCWVGSVCIDNFIPHLKKEKNFLISQYKNKELGNSCLYCDAGLVDMRKKYHREFFCDFKCKKKMIYSIPFGKFKNKIMLEVMYTEEGNNYFCWIKEQLLQNPSSFSQYPLFLEIIEENTIDFL